MQHFQVWDQPWTGSDLSIEQRRSQGRILGGGQNRVDQRLQNDVHNAKSMIAKLAIDIYNTLEWFDSNSTIVKPSKFQVMLLGRKRIKIRFLK